MKKIILGLGLLMTGSLSLNAQGLEGFVAERFYVTAAGDNGGNGVNATPLPTGSVVWRFYADLAPGWQLLNVYGNDINPLQISTSTTFFNNYDRGNTFGNQINAATITQAAAYIDSYLSLGGTCSNRLGLTKATDDATNNFAFVAPYLQNNDPSVGQPLTARDGSFNATGTVITPQTVGLTAANLDNFSQSPVGSSFLVNTPTGGGYFAPAGTGAVGPNADNRVLIAQITSDGVLTYKFNLIIQNTTSLVSEDWVSSSAGAGQQLLAAMAGVVNQPNATPIVSITAPPAGTNYLVGQNVNIVANASDPDGTIDSVAFFVNSVRVGVDLTGSLGTSGDYNFTWVANSTGTKNLTARAYDNGGASTLSTIVAVTVGSVIPPTVSVTAPTAGTTYVLGDVASIDVTATDQAPGTVTSVQLQIDGIPFGAPAPGPGPSFNFLWPVVVGNHSISAVATDNDNASTTSASVSVSVFDSSSAYVLVSSNNPCSNNTFCLPLNAITPVNDVIGYDVVLQFDNTKVQPTGIVTVDNDLIDPSWTSTASSIDNANGLIYFSVFFNANAPANAEFNGSGQLLCVEFVRTAGFGSEDTADFAINSLQESYFNGVLPKVVSPGQYSTFQEGTFSSNLKFWFDGSPIRYDIGTPSAYLITNIYGDNNTCTGPLSATAVQPDLAGNFSYDIANGPSINIQKDIPGTTSVQPVVNGFDAFLTRRVLVNDVTFVPSVYQIVAMDVNIDGVVSAGDLSQINQRAVLIIDEFRQAWNYTSGGVSNGQPSKDWLFLDGAHLNGDPNYLISALFPFDDGTGYSRFRVPVTPFCLEVPQFVSATCTVFGIEAYTGILVGDVNGNYATVVPNNIYRAASDRVIFDLTKAVSGKGYVDVPVTVMSSEPIHAVDFALQFNESKMSFSEVVTENQDVEALSNFNFNDHSLRYTSFSLGNYDLTKPVASVRFATQSNSIDAADLRNIAGYLNGDAANVEVIGNRAANTGVLVNVFPNPAASAVNVIVSENASFELTDMNGRLVAAEPNVVAYEKYEINTGSYAKGVYSLKVHNNNTVSVTKIVVE